MRLSDESASGADRCVYASADGRSGVPIEQLRQAPGGDVPGIHFRQKLPIADLTWTVYATPTRGYLANQRTWGPVVVLCVGLLLSFWLVVHYVLITARSENVDCANAALHAEVAERTRVESALKQSETHLRQIIDLVPQQIFAKDRDGTFLLANRTVADMYGTTVDELVGSKDVDFIPPGKTSTVSRPRTGKSSTAADRPLCPKRS